MLYRYRDQWRRLKFDLACRNVYRTAPADVAADGPLALFTQMQHKDLTMGLAAFKTFARQVPAQAYYVLNDGSLSDDDKAKLRAHLPGLHIFERQNVANGHCPQGGCWERLLCIADLSTRHYVIQLDADTLTLGDLPEVCAKVAQNASFAIGTWDNQEIESMSYRVEKARAVQAQTSGRTHVQVEAEACFDVLENYAAMKYLRGCAGFSGFARGSVSRDFIQDVSRQMEKALGTRWHEWGSEQVMSNIVVANGPGASALPHPEYCDCTRMRAGRTRFVHFIGSCRFDGGVYANLARRAIESL